MMEMFPPQRILCPVDFSPHSERALQVAGWLATAFTAEVIVLHAQSLEPPLYFTVAQIAALEGQLRRARRAARAYLEGFAGRQMPPALPRSFEVVEADPAAAILAAAQAPGAGLIVMGTHGRTGLTRIRLGSVTESVLRQSHIPVVTVGPQVEKVEKLAPAQVPARILCPVDYSDQVRAVLRHAGLLAQTLRAQLIVLHVQEAVGPKRDAKQSLCDWVPTTVREQCAVREVVRQGSPAEQIVQETERSAATLLVIGAAHHHTLGAIFAGSTAEKLIRAAPVPVVSVPQPQS